MATYIATIGAAAVGALWVRIRTSKKEGDGQEAKVVAASFKTDHLLGDVKAAILAADGTGHERLGLLRDMLEQLHAIHLVLEKIEVRMSVRDR